MITNELEDNIMHGWLYVIRSFLHFNIRIQYQLINLIWLSFDFFSFSWSLTICFFVAFILLCVQLPKNIMKCLLNYTVHVNKWMNKDFIYSWIKLHKHLLKWKIKTVLKEIKSKYKKKHDVKSKTYLIIIAKNKTRTKPSCITFKLTTCSIVRFSLQTMQWCH